MAGPCDARLVATVSRLARALVGASSEAVALSGDLAYGVATAGVTDATGADLVRLEAVLSHTLGLAVALRSTLDRAAQDG